MDLHKKMELHTRSATIAIITCRRPIWLKRLLESLTKQSVDKNTLLNILVVDNASEQTAVDIVNEISSVSPFKITYACEKTAGIVAARNKCITEFLQTDAQYLFFIDDDEWPAENNWAQKLLNKQKEYNADVVTSHVLSVGEQDTPSWAVELIYGKNPLKEGDVVAVKNKSLTLKAIGEALSVSKIQNYSWLTWDNTSMAGQFMSKPLREDIPEVIKEQLIVELYSK